MLYRTSKIKLLLTSIITCVTFQTYSQTNSEISLYNWHDSTIGKENLAINNGSIYVNKYKTIGANNMFYITDAYSKGTVGYEGQIYYDVNLKYDIFQDQLILKPYGESNYIGINLNSEKISFFIINEKKFLNLDYNTNNLPNYVKGYYEVYLMSGTNILYIKHHKDMIEIINNNNVFKEFKEKNEFLLQYGNSFYKIESKKDLIKIFPNSENKISDYYFKNKDLEKLDETKFMGNLLKSINF